jgi:hypothetical protein
LNVTPIVQVAPAASGAEQLLLAIENATVFAPVSCQPMADSVVVPVLCTVIVCAALVVPPAWLPNDRLVGLTDIDDPAATPVPDRPTSAGLPDALLAMLTEAVFAPDPGGLNFTPIVQVAPAATAAEQPLLPIEKAAVLAPVSVTPLTVSDVVPVFLTVIVCAVLVVPPAWVPNDRFVGLTDTVGPAATPVPDRPTSVGLPGALLAMLNEADFAPDPGGLNVTPILQKPPAAIAAVQPLLVIENATVFAPVNVTPLTDNDAVPVLCTVIV